MKKIITAIIVCFSLIFSAHAQTPKNQRKENKAERNAADAERFFTLNRCSG